MAKLAAFFLDGDTASLREEVRRFTGPNAEKFLPVFDVVRDRQASAWKRAFVGFCWPAFLTGPVWFFYRKLWWHGVAICVAMVALAFIPHLPPRIGLIISLTCGIIGRRSYVMHALSRLRALRETGRVDQPGAIEAAGGVSRLAAWISGTISVLFILGLIVLLVVAVEEGVPLPPPD